MNATDLTVANTIASQIGQRAFFMMGTRHKIGEEMSLGFDVRGCKKWKHVKVTLTPLDTYTVSFFQQGPAPAFKVTRLDVEDIYAEGLHQCIEYHTGLKLSL